MLEDFSGPKVDPFNELTVTMYLPTLPQFSPKIKLLVDIHTTNSSDKRPWVMEALETQSETQKPCCNFGAEFEKEYNRQVYDPVGLVPQKDPFKLLQKEPFGFFELMQNVNAANFKWQILGIECEKVAADRAAKASLSRRTLMPRILSTWIFGWSIAEIHEVWDNQLNSMYGGQEYQNHQKKERLAAEIEGEMEIGVANVSLVYECFLKGKLRNAEFENQRPNLNLIVKNHATLLNKITEVMPDFFQTVENKLIAGTSINSAHLLIGVSKGVLKLLLFIMI